MADETEATTATSTLPLEPEPDELDAPLDFAKINLVWWRLCRRKRAEELWRLRRATNSKELERLVSDLSGT